jgi:hypothetical protein
LSAFNEVGAPLVDALATMVAGYSKGSIYQIVIIRFGHEP